MLRGTRYGREPDRKPLILIYNTNVQLFEKPGVARNQITNPIPHLQHCPKYSALTCHEWTETRPQTLNNVLQHCPTYSSLVCQAWPETRAQTLDHTYNTAQRTVLWYARRGQKPDHKPYTTSTTLPNAQCSEMPGVARNQTTNPRPRLQHCPA